MKRLFYPVILSALAMTIAACEKERGTDPAPAPEPARHAVSVTPETSLLGNGTTVDVLQDPIYAYAFNSEGQSDGLAIKPSSISNGSYTYMIPTDAATLIFSNRMSDDTMNVVSEGDSLVFIYTSINTKDLVAGTVAVTQGSSSYGVNLRRLTAKLDLELEMKATDGTILDCHDYMQYASVQVFSQAKSTSINVHGEVKLSETPIPYPLTPGLQTTPGTYLYPICSDISIFPTAPGWPETIELTLVNQEGAESTLSRTLDYVFEANKHYKLRLSMKRVETGSQFVIDEIVNEELTVDLN